MQFLQRQFELGHSENAFFQPGHIQNLYLDNEVFAIRQQGFDITQGILHAMQHGNLIGIDNAKVRNRMRFQIFQNRIEEANQHGFWSF